MMKLMYQLHADSASRAHQYILPCIHHHQYHRRTPTLSCITLRRRQRLSEVAVLARTILLKMSPKSRTNTFDMAVFQRPKGVFFFALYTNNKLVLQPLFQVIIGMPLTQSLKKSVALCHCWVQLSFINPLHLLQAVVSLLFSTFLVTFIHLIFALSLPCL